MTEDLPFNPDTSGTHPNSQPVGEAPETMAKAIAAFSTAVRVLPDGTKELINGPPQLPVAPYTIDTRSINAEPHLCAIAPDGSVIVSRGQGNVSSPELYDLVDSMAQDILGTQE